MNNEGINKSTNTTIRWKEKGKFAARVKSLHADDYSESQEVYDEKKTCWENENYSEMSRSNAPNEDELNNNDDDTNDNSYTANMN